MHGPGGCTDRARHGASSERAEVAERRAFRGSGRNVEELAHERSEEPELIDGLICVPAAHAVRPVRSEHEQGCFALRRLDHGGEQVGGRRAGGAQERDGLATLPGYPRG